MRLLRFTTIVLALLCVPFASAQREKSASAMDGNNKPKKQVQLEPSWAWRITEPLGERRRPVVAEIIDDHDLIGERGTFDAVLDVLLFIFR